MPAAIATILYIDLMVLLHRSGSSIAGVMLFALVVALVIILHEFGHFATAKAFGIKVTEFFLGFGPRLWSFRRGETEYGVKAIPAGGYVRIAGMNPFLEEPPEDHPRTFAAKPAWQRFIVLVSGALTHFVLAYLLLLPVLVIAGLPKVVPGVAAVEQTLNGRPSPAAVDGLADGDVILSVDGMELDPEEFIEYVQAHANRPLLLELERNGKRLLRIVTPIEAELDGEVVGRLGVRVAYVDAGRDKSSLPEAFGDAGRVVGSTVVEAVNRVDDVFGPSGIKRLFQLLAGGERSIEDPVGLIGAGRLAGQAVSAGQFDAFIGLFVGFNVFVGLLNLLPLPPLDGGHVLFLGIEKITGRPVDLRRVIPVMAVVGGFLIIYTLLLLYVDIANPIPNPFGP